MNYSNYFPATKISKFKIILINYSNYFPATKTFKN